jgi:NADH-quinone oxidoreductase subunit M
MLIALLLAPVLGAVALLVVARPGSGTMRAVAGGAAGAALLIAIRAVVACRASSLEGYRLVERIAWAPAFGVEVFLGVDGLRALLVLMTTLITLAAVVGSRGSGADLRRRLLALLVLEAGLLGVFVALDLFFLAMVWTTLVAAAGLMSGRGPGAGRFLIGALGGCALMLGGVLLVGDRAGAFDLTVLASMDAFRDAPALGRMAFVLLGAGFAIPMTVFPFHRAPIDHAIEAPPSIVVLGAGVLPMAGAFGMLTVALPLVPEAAAYFADVLAVLGAAGLLSAGLLLMRRTDLVGIAGTLNLAFSGLVLLGLGAIASGAGEEAATGVALLLVHGGMAIGLLLLIAAALVDRAGHGDCSRFGGLLRSMPRLGILAGLSLLGLACMPGLSPFPSVLLTLLGSLSTHPIATLIGIVGLILVTGRTAWVAGHLLLGAPREIGLYRDLTAAETGSAGGLALLIVLFGILPALAADLVAGPMGRLLADLAGGG